jgi:hypothetical protein
VYIYIYTCVYRKYRNPQEGGQNGRIKRDCSIFWEAGGTDFEGQTQPRQGSNKKKRQVKKIDVSTY